MVVRADEGEIIIDLGLERGLQPGDEIRFYRRIVVNHPVTGKQIIDRFPIGIVRPAEVGTHLSIVTGVRVEPGAPGALRRMPKKGDFAVVVRARAPVAAAAAPSASAASTERAVRSSRPADEVAIEAVLAQTLGEPLSGRIAAWESWQRAFPDSAHANAVGRELAVLRAHRERAREAATPEPPPPVTVRFDSVRRIRVGRPAEMALAVENLERVEEMRLLVRRKGATSWEEVDASREPDGYYRAPMPPELTAGPGQLEYLFEAVRDDATLQPVAGTLSQPRRLSVRPAPVGEGAEGHSRAAILTEYVDFNLSGDAADHYLRVEGAFTYDVGWWQMDAFRVGVGTIDGEGGPTEAIDAGEPTRKLTLGYAFAETQFGFGEWVGTSTKIIGGNHRATAEGTAKAVVGFEGRLRFGRRLGTRLEIGGSLLEDLGNQGVAEMFIEVFPRVPISAAVAVTNLPVDADLGVRLTSQAGYRFTDWLTLQAVFGWNARTITHQGLTTGAALALDW
jgi:hypothetical protein